MDATIGTAVAGTGGATARRQSILGWRRLVACGVVALSALGSEYRWRACCRVSRLYRRAWRGICCQSHWQRSARDESGSVSWGLKADTPGPARSEERRVGKGGRARWWPEQ